MAREASARAALQDAERFFEGELLLEEAWPRYAGAPLNDTAWVAGQLARLDQLGAARATERLATQGARRADGGGKGLAVPEQLAATLRAEADAQALERELLHRLQGLLSQHPRLSAEAIEPWRSTLQARRAEAAAAWKNDPTLALAVAEADAELADLDAVVRGAIDHATRGADLPVVVVEDLADLRRAELLADLEPGALAALKAWTTEVDTPGALDDAEALLASLQAWQVGGHPALAGWLGAEAERIDALVQGLRARADESLIDTTVEEAERRRIEAENALAAARDDVERRELELAAEVASQQEQAATYVGAVDTRGETLEAELESLTLEVNVLVEEVRTVLDTPRDLKGARDERAGKTYRKLRQKVSDLRVLVATAQEDQNAAETDGETRRAQAAETLDRLEFQLADSADAERDLQNALRAVDLTSRSALEQEKSHRAGLLLLLTEIKTARRLLRPEVPAEVLREDDVIGDAVHELSMAADTMWSLGRDRVDAALNLPDRLTDLGAIRGFLSGAFWVIVGLLAWRFSRPRAVIPVRFLIQRAAEQRPKAFRRELTALEAPAEPVVVALVDGLAVILLVGPALAIVPEVGLLLLVWLQVAAYRLVVGLWDLLIARGGTRLALVVLPVDAWELGRRSVRWLMTWAIVRQFLGRALLEILVADALHQLLHTAFNVVLLVLAVRLLHEWEPILRRRIAREGTDNAVRAYLASEPAQPRVTRWYRALLDFVLLGVSWSWRFVQGQAREGSPLARLLNVFYRYSLSSSEAEQEQRALLEPLPAELEATYTAPATRDDFVRRTDMDERFWGAIRRWEKERRHGTVAFVADRGAGRTTWLDRACLELAAEGKMVARVVLDHRCLDEEALCQAVGAGLGDPDIDSVDGLEALLDNRPPGFILLEDAHLSFLRKVGGLDGVRALLEVLGRTSDRHFWVVTFHLPAWHYISRLGVLLKVHIFQHVLEMPAMPEGELRELLGGRTEAAGYAVDYSQLVRRGALSGDQADELERATVAFYRVLGEASYGNPRTAVELWKECVRADTDGRRVEVHMGHALSESRLMGLSEAELFVLAALRMQDGLTEQELAEVNNMRPGQVRASLQVLRGRGLLDLEGECYVVPPRKQATVTRTLQHRNFLDWRA